jgi:transposase
MEHGSGKEPVADRAYDNQAFRQQLRRRGIKPTLPAFERRHKHRPKRGRPTRTGPSYRQRWEIERCFGGMDNCPRLVVRYERSVEHYKAFGLMASILWGVNLILKYLVHTGCHSRRCAVARTHLTAWVSLPEVRRRACTVHFGHLGGSRPAWAMREAFRSPRYTTNWKELPIVR